MKDHTQIASEIYWKIYSELGFGTLTMCATHGETFVIFRWTFKAKKQYMVIEECCDLYMLGRMHEREHYAVRLAAKWKHSFKKTEQQQTDHCPKESTAT